MFDIIEPDVSAHAFQFGPDSFCWAPSHDHNELFVYTTAGFLNSLMLARGHMFMNDVHDAFGIKRTREGQRYGWLGAFPIKFEIVLTRIDAPPGVLLIDPNPDGIIWDSI